MRSEPLKRSYNEPTVGDYVGYTDMRLETSLPVEKVPYAFTITVTERPHPDSAFLELEFDVQRNSSEILGRQIALVLTTDPELPWNENHRTLNESAILKLGGLHEISLNVTHCCVMKLESDRAGRRLTLHVLERNYHYNDEAYDELKSVSVEPIALGNCCTLKIPIPKK